MRSLLVVALLMGSFAHAETMREYGFFEEIGSIFGTIIDHQINKEKKKQENKWTPFDREGELILRNNGNRIVFGKVFLENYRDEDIIRMPRCRFSANHRVNQLRLQIRNQGADINSLKITFGNGRQRFISIEERFKADERTHWIDVGRRHNNRGRCITEIRVNGKSLSRRPNRSVVRVVGKIRNQVWED